MSGMNFVVRVLVNAVAIWVASWILPGMHIYANPVVTDSVGNQTVSLAVSYLVVGLLFGVANALLKPIIEALSLPVTCLTLGLFSVIINAAMLSITAWLSGFTPFVFTIDRFFFTAILAALIVSVVSAVLGRLVPESAAREPRR